MSITALRDDYLLDLADIFAGSESTILGTGGHLDDRIARMLDHRDRYGVDADVALTVPTQCTHAFSPYEQDFRQDRKGD